MDRKELAFSTVGATLCIYLALVAVALSSPGFLGRLEGVIGSEPFGYGLPLKIFVIVFLAVISMPVPIFVWAFLTTAIYAKERHRSTFSFGPIGVLAEVASYVRYLVKSEGETLQIRRAKIITLAGILYFFGVLAWWIYWTSSHGI